MAGIFERRAGDHAWLYSSGVRCIVKSTQKHYDIFGSDEALEVDRAALQRRPVEHWFQCVVLEDAIYVLLGAGVLVNSYSWSFWEYIFTSLVCREMSIHILFKCKQLSETWVESTVGT